MFQTDDGVGEKDREEEEEWFVLSQRQPVKRSGLSTFSWANLFKKAQSLLQQGFWFTGVDPQVFVKLAAPSSGQIYVQHFTPGAGSHWLVSFCRIFRDVQKCWSFFDILC